MRDVNGPQTPAGAWEKLTNERNDLYWSGFTNKFSFHPGVREDSFPGIDEPTPSVTFALPKGPTKELYSLNNRRLNSDTLSGFRFATDTALELVVLDWQHQGYLFRPDDASTQDADNWKLSVYPNGDYHIFVTASLEYGIFGHPWERTICIFGEKLVSTLSPLLMDWLVPVRVDGKKVS